MLQVACFHPRRRRRPHLAAAGESAGGGVDADGGGLAVWDPGGGPADGDRAVAPDPAQFPLQLRWGSVKLESYCPTQVPGMLERVCRATYCA